MKSTLTIENAATWFNAKTVTHHLDAIIDTRTHEEPVGPANVTATRSPALCAGLSGERGERA